MSGIRPEQFDYNAAVDRADAEGFDWNSLADATQDPGFGSLSEEQRTHIWDLLRVKSERKYGNRVDPHAATGELGALRQLGSALKQVLIGATPDVAGREAHGLTEAMAFENENKERATAAFINQGYSKDQAEQQRQKEVEQAGRDVVQQFGHYFTGGLIPAPAESKDVYVQDIIEKQVKPATMLAAVAGQIATGNFLLGLVSKVPLISGAAENLSTFTRGMIKYGILDFGINAAWPEGMPKEDRFGISDDIARALSPQSVRDNPGGPMGRVMMGVGGALEGALFGSVLHGFSTGVKLADAKYAFSAKPEMMERVKQSLQAAGVDITGMSRRDVMMNYRMRMTEHIQGFDEAAFNGQRLSAEEWIAQSFLSDPSITELTPAEGRLLYKVFSTNKGGVSVIQGITNPEEALQKLRKVGINVDATILPRRNPGGVGVSNRDVLVSDTELDRAVTVDPELVGAKIAQTPKAKRVRPTKVQVKTAEERATDAERRASEAERKAQTDGLTGLDNQESWKSAKARVDADPNLEVVALDMGNFKQLNDQMGHEAGDRALQTVAQHLKAGVEGLPGAQVFRTGGDEFVMVVPKGMGKATLGQVQEKFWQQFGSKSKPSVHIRGGVGQTYADADQMERAVRQEMKDRVLGGTRTNEKLYADPVISMEDKKAMMGDLAFHVARKVEDGIMSTEVLSTDVLLKQAPYLDRKWYDKYPHLIENMGTVEGQGPHVRLPTPESNPITPINPRPVAPEVEYTLPGMFARSAPRYGYGAKNFSIEFSSDIDRAAYIIQGVTKSKAHQGILKDVMEKTGMTETQIRLRGQAVRAQLKEMAKDGIDGSTLRL